MKTYLSKCWVLLFTIVGFQFTSYAQQSAQSIWENYDPKAEPINAQVLKTWENDKGKFEYVVYDIGKLEGDNKSASPKVAAYYGYPKDAKNVPAIVHIHGGGQRAELSRVETWVKLGYACISINWGEKPLEDGLQNTDWDDLPVGFLGKDKGLGFHNTVTPTEKTLYKEPNAYNSSWVEISISARRAITFLEERAEVDPNRIGLEGHSMGGFATVMTANDPRIKAAAPSVGGSGYLHQDMWGLPKSKRHMRTDLELFQKTIASQSSWPLIKTPILFLGSTNDFNSPTELVVKGMSLLPKSTENILVLAPHLNHRFTKEAHAARFLWMDAHVKGTFTFPKKSASELKLKTKNNIPVFTVVPDQSSGLPIEKVEIFYGYSRDPRNRFWHSAEVKQKKNKYYAECPVFDDKEPLYAFANITYKIDHMIPAHPGKDETNLFTVSSEYQMAYPDELQSAKVKATARRYAIIDDFSNGMQDWYTLFRNNHHHWFFGTRKLFDPCFMGPKGGKLKIQLETNAEDNQLAVGIETNTWQNYTGRRKENYYAVVTLKDKGINTLELSPEDFVTNNGKPLKDWDEVTELTLSPAFNLHNKMKADERWKGDTPTMKSMKWIGGDFTKWRRIYPHEKRDDADVQKVISFDNEFQQAIDKSVELEDKDKGSK
ncbi:prolyl oligopeptidase family serine peptidase [Flammeovirga yaeyamensis]|uniref:Prolyl oligopeptidase family serine peptidase n=1 Tax=Flammeovirga yaeyamensis TaxID=367791 RepID=A0AAX1ND78_9BACT|nr:prolyl oligopeptidase family serine peptidase [Flammeovirga yaeyamensis]MBB3699552.1 dienelactone hydrolase [Flammeovirga yaeyamensis]NMF35193.1 prolyl oligopeptidase family serine peptidase [Flammeovirga yaeyamensis]QWG04057.1 prolyl oligopeptidase family serine peptidase [Flammeovirga yaeyamensis]